MAVARTGTEATMQQVSRLVAAVAGGAALALARRAVPRGALRRWAADLREAAAALDDLAQAPGERELTDEEAQAEVKHWERGII